MNAFVKPPFKVRASSWGELFDCAHKWEGKHLLGMNKPSGVRALLGTSLHAGTAAFDQARIEGALISADDAAGIMIDTLMNPAFDVDLKADGLPVRDAQNIGLALISRYCLEISPRYEFVAVEMETTPLTISCGGGVTVQLTGTLDRSRIKKGSEGTGIADLKSGGGAVLNGVAKTKGHRAQVGTYELLYEHSTGEVITAPAEIIGLKTKGTPEIGVGEIRDARLLMVGADGRRGLIEFAADMFRTGLFPPNPQSQLCSEKYCPRWATCHYHD